MPRKQTVAHCYAEETAALASLQRNAGGKKVSKRDGLTHSGLQRDCGYPQSPATDAKTRTRPISAPLSLLRCRSTSEATRLKLFRDMPALRETLNESETIQIFMGYYQIS